MNWITFSLLSAVFLGFYEIAKKVSLKDNAVPPVLFGNVMTSALIYVPVIIACRILKLPLPFAWAEVDPLTWSQHAMLFAKAVIAGSSWIFASFALKHLPMSIASPIRASSPLWTIIVAVTFMHERPTFGQWIGVSLILLSFYAFSLVGRGEGIRFHRDRWVGFMVLATLLGSLSALYDKYLLQTCGFRSATVQAWFSVYLVVVMLPVMYHWVRYRRSLEPFQWRWSIPLIALLLLVSDFLYFFAIENPDARIAVVSPLRRTSVIIAFAAGILIYGEKKWQEKAACIAGLLAGVYVVALSR